MRIKRKAESRRTQHKCHAYILSAIGQNKTLCQYHTHIAYFMPSSDENLSTLHQTNFLFNTSTSLKKVKKCKIGKMRTRKPRNLAKTKTNHFSPSSSFLCSKMTYQISISDRTRWLEWILSRSLYCKVVRRLI